MNVAMATSEAATAALVKAITGTAVSEGALMTYHNGMAVGVHTASALSRRVA